MSAENDSENGNAGSSVCRDFLRNVCKRGYRCKYTHPNKKAKSNEFSFCHDFMNSKCLRASCRFVHGSEQEEEYYAATGELPPHIVIPGVGNTASGIKHGEVPVCKDYTMKGECRRGGKCKFRHLAVGEYEKETNPIKVKDETRRRHFEDVSYNYNPDFDRGFCPPEVKRRHFEPASPPLFQREVLPMTNHYYQPVSMTLHDENSFLRKRLDELRKQVSDLTATNEFLLQQNAKLRTSGAMPSVTSTMQVQPMTAQTIPTSTQHLVNGTLRTVTASVATVPVSIATVAGTPVSIATVSMAPVQMQPPIVTMAQTITVDGAHSSQLNGSTASLLSYPIMTHDLRPVL